MAARFALAALLVFSVAMSVSAEGDDLLAWVKATVGEHPVVMFSKTYCPYCRRAKEAFRTIGATPHVVELDIREDGPLIQDALQEYVGRRSVPQVFIGGEHLGGSDDTVDALDSGRLKVLVDAATGAKEL